MTEKLKEIISLIEKSGEIISLLEKGREKVNADAAGALDPIEGAAYIARTAREQIKRKGAAATAYHELVNEQARGLRRFLDENKENESEESEAMGKLFLSLYEAHEECEKVVRHYDYLFAKFNTITRLIGEASSELRLIDTLDHDGPEWAQNAADAAVTEIEEFIEVISSDFY